MKTKQIVLFLLVFSMLASTLIGCGTDSPVETDSGDTVSAVVEETAVETELTPDLPEVKYDGTEFRMMYRYGSHAYNVTDMWVEGLTGEIINDSVYNRNLEVEQKFDVTLVPIEDEAPQKKIKTSVSAGEDFAHILADRMMDMFPVTLEGYLYNWHDIAHVDFSKPWWDANAAAELTFGNQLYMMFGDFSLSASNGAQLMWFNKDMLTDYGFEHPYKDVFDGTWTVDKMLAMVTAVSEDLDGDGKMAPGDRFGMLTQVPYRLTTAFGIKFTERTEDNYPVLAPLSEQMIDGMEIVTALMNDKENTISYNEMAAGQDTSAFPNQYAYGRSKFAQDQILFVECSMGFADELKEMESPYGVLTMPKFDENQDRYYHIADEYSCAWAIPTTVGDVVMTGVLLEYLSYASDDLVDAVYETTLKGKRMDAPDDAAVLDLVRSTTWYEITFIAGAGIREMLEAAVKSGNLASEYAARESKISAKLDACRP